MDDHTRTAMAQHATFVRRAIRVQDNELDHAPLSCLMDYAANNEAMLRDMTTRTEAQVIQIGIHLINAYLRKVWTWHRAWGTYTRSGKPNIPTIIYMGKEE